MKDWIPVVSAFLGFVAGLSGTWLTQRASRQLETARWQREQAKAKETERRQLYVDVVEYIEDRLAWLRNADWSVEQFEAAKLGLHRNQLAGRVKMSAPRSVVVGWEYFRYHLEGVQAAFRLGNVRESRELPDTIELIDESLIPEAVIAGEIAILVIRAEIESKSLPDLLGDLKYDSLPDDPRYRGALEKFWEDTSIAGSPWTELPVWRV